MATYLGGALLPTLTAQLPYVPVPPPKTAPKTTVAPTDPAIITAGNKYDGEIFFANPKNAAGEWTYTVNIYTQGHDFAPEPVSAVGYAGAAQIDEGKSAFVSTELDANGNLLYRVQYSDLAQGRDNLPKPPTDVTSKFLKDALLAAATVSTLGIQPELATKTTTQSSSRISGGQTVFSGKIVSGTADTINRYSFELYKDGLGGTAIIQPGVGWPGDSLIPNGTYVIAIPEGITIGGVVTRYRVVNPKPDFDVMPGKVNGGGNHGEYTVNVYPRAQYTEELVGNPPTKLVSAVQAGLNTYVAKGAEGLVVKRVIGGEDKYTLFAASATALPAKVLTNDGNGNYTVDIFPNGVDDQENNKSNVSVTTATDDNNIPSGTAGIVVIMPDPTIADSDYIPVYNFFAFKSTNTTAPGQITGGAGFRMNALGVASQFYNVRYYPNGTANDFLSVVAELLPDENGVFADLATNLWVLVTQSGEDSEGNPLYYISESPSTPGGSMPGKVLSKISGNDYSVQVYPDGLSEDAQTVTCKQLQIDTSETIPANTWVIVTKNAEEYAMQVPVYL